MSNSSKRHFDDFDIKELIRQYKKHNCLWNINSPNYKCKSLKNDAWLEISKHFHKNVNEVKRKIKYLRSAYVAEKRKVDASKKFGTGTPHKPLLFYYNELDFLDSIVVLRKFGNDTDHTDLEYENTNVSPDTDANEYDKETDINCKIESIADSEQELSHSPEMPLSNSPKILYSRSLPSRPVKRKICAGTELNNSMQRSTATLTSTSSGPCKNLYIMFGKTIALQLKELPMEVAMTVMSQIQNLLTKTTLEYLKSLKKRSEPLSYSDESCDQLMEEIFDD